MMNHQQEIESLREELNKMILTGKALSSNEILVISQRLDRVIEKYLNREKENNTND